MAHYVFEKYKSETNTTTTNLILFLLSVTQFAQFTRTATHRLLAS